MTTLRPKSTTKPKSTPKPRPARVRYQGSAFLRDISLAVDEDRKKREERAA